MPFRPRPPLVIKQRQLVRQRRPMCKNLLPLLHLQVNLRRIQRHHEHRHTRRQQRPQPRRIAADVPLRIRRTTLAVAPVISAIDAPTHHHHPLELAKRRRIALDRRLNIVQRPNRDQRNLARMHPNLIEQKADRVGMCPASGIACVVGVCPIRQLRKALSVHHPRICSLCKDVFRLGSSTLSHGEIPAPHRIQIPIH